MFGIIRSALALLVAVFLMMAGSGPLGSMISLRLDASAAVPVAVGIIMAAYFAGLTLGSLFAYRIVLRAGHIRAFTAFVSFLSATALVYAIHLDLGLWAMLRLAEGFCMAGVFVCIESWLNARATAQTRGRILALYMVSGYFGQAGGQFLLNLDDDTGFLPFVAISILLSVAVVPVALTRMSPPPLPDVASFSFRRLYRASPLGIVGTVASGLVLGSLYSLGPIFARAVGLDLSDTALFISVVIFGGVLLQWPLGRLSDRFDRRVVIVCVMAGLLAVSLGTAATAGLGRDPLLVAAVLFGGAAYSLYPLCVAHTNDHLAQAERVSASGGLVLAYSIGATAGPLAASAVISVTGAQGLFLFTAAVGATTMAFGLWRMRVRPPVPSALQGRYQTLPQTTPVAAPLDPRGDEASARRTR